MVLKKVRIFDGAKCTGKTTLINQLVKEEEKKNRVIKVKHFGLDDEHSLKNYLKLLHDSENDGTEVLIVDRYFLGELIYPIIYSRDPYFTLKELLESQLWNKLVELNNILEDGCKTIILYDKNDNVTTLIERWIEREKVGNFALEGKMSNVRIKELHDSNQMFNVIGKLMKQIDSNLFELKQI